MRLLCFILWLAFQHLCLGAPPYPYDTHWQQHFQALEKALLHHQHPTVAPTVLVGESHIIEPFVTSSFYICHLQQ